MTDTLRQVLRFLAIAVLAVLMAGFGLCGVVGLVSGGLTSDGNMMIRVFGLIGLFIAVGAALAIRGLWRGRSRPDSEADA
jgi:hypothetical protein